MVLTVVTFVNLCRSIFTVNYLLNCIIIETYLQVIAGFLTGLIGAVVELPVEFAWIEVGQELFQFSWHGVVPVLWEHIHVPEAVEGSGLVIYSILLLSFL